MANMVKPNPAKPQPQSLAVEVKDGDKEELLYLSSLIFLACL